MPVLVCERLRRALVTRYIAIIMIDRNNDNSNPGENQPILANLLLLSYHHLSVNYLPQRAQNFIRIILFTQLSFMMH